MDVLVLNAGADAALYPRTELLRAAGFTVLQAGSANDTLAALASDPLPTVLVLSVFDDMDVRDVVRAVREHPRTTFIKTLHLAPADLGIAYHTSCLESGASLVMPETVAAEVLVAQIRALGAWVSRSNAALEESEARFRLISDATPLGIAIVDLRGGTFLFANPACEGALGYGPGQLLGRHSGEVFSDPTEGEDLLARIREKGSLSNVEVRLKRADGSSLWALGSARSLHFAGAPAAISVVSDVTERKRIEQALHESEQRFRLALRHAPVSVAMQDRDLRYVWAFNEHAVRQAVDLGLGDQDLFPVEQARHLTALKRRVVEEGIELREQLWLDRRDGRIFVDACFEPIRDNEGNIVGVGTAAVNLTGMKLAEQALRESRERYEAIFASAPFAIALLDGGQRIVEANGAAERMFGVSRQEAVGKTPSELGTLEARDIDYLYAQLGQHPSVSGVELHYTTRKGEPCLAEFSMSRVTLRGQVYFLGTATDVTKQRRAESDLQHANAMLEESDRRKDEFIAILSHELRNPLAPIRYALPLLHPAEEDEAATRALGVIHRQVDHLTRLVDDLLDVSRISGGIIELRREHRRLEAVVHAAVEAAMPAISAARHWLDVEMPSAPVVIFGDAARLSQVITNLLNNSARYTGRGGTIRLSVRLQEDRIVVIEVRDNGIGIPREALPHVFEMFRQVERPDRRQGGLGVGLALVKRLVEMHGGTVTAESRGVGEGATFTLRLPIAVPPPDVDQVEVTSRQARAAAPMRVLIVDDSADLVEMLSIAVASAGHEVRKALDGQSAVAAALSFRPHVVLLDLGLPVLGGLEVASELRRHPETANAWLVALTGWGQAEDRRHTREAGFDYHLTKPTDPSELQQLLCSLSSQIR